MLVDEISSDDNMGAVKYHVSMLDTNGTPGYREPLQIELMITDYL